MNLTFLGATGTVTGSKYLVSTASQRLLVDCGLFQGLKQLRLRNREPFPIPPESLQAVILTHAHLDHSGYLPLLVRNGFAGPVYCTAATADLLGILLPDSGHLQEEEAEFANRHGYTKHRPALPLYTRQDAEDSLRVLQPVPWQEEVPLGGGELSFQLLPAGHILGAAMVRLHSDETTILFSGDLGRASDPVLPPPTRVSHADYLLVESTYGDRLHDPHDSAEQLADVIRRTVRRGGVVLIPAFAVGRTQHLLYLLHRLKVEQRIPEIPIYLDSPMATRATEIFRSHSEDLRLSREECEAACSVAEPVDTVEQSKKIDAMSFPRVIVSASGMATGGRVLHHLKVFAPDPRNTVLFSGFQAAGTRGATMLSGAGSVKIHGSYVPVRAEVCNLNTISAHADYSEILQWLRGFEAPPRQTFITHGEPVAADALRRRIEEDRGWRCTVPEYRDSVVLGNANESSQVLDVPQPILAPTS